MRVVAESEDVAMVSAPPSASAEPSCSKDPLMRAAIAAGFSNAHVTELAENLAPLIAQKTPGRCPGIAKRKGGTNWPPQKVRSSLSKGMR